MKPESTLNFKVEELTVSVVAHRVRVTNQLLADMPAPGGVYPWPHGVWHPSKA